MQVFFSDLIYLYSKSTILPENFETLVKSSAMWIEARNQSECVNDCDLFVRDASTTDLVYAMHLYKEALRTGMNLRCRIGTGVCAQLAGMPPQDWRNHLEATTTHVKRPSGDGFNIRFHTFLPDEMDLFAANEKNQFELVRMK